MCWRALSEALRVSSSSKDKQKQIRKTDLRVMNAWMAICITGGLVGVVLSGVPLTIAILVSVGVAGVYVVLRYMVKA